MSADRPVRFGLVGCGAIAVNYAKAFDGLGNAQLMAVSDVVPERAARFAAAYGAEDAGSTQALLERSDIDAVIVCTPSGLHAEVGLAVAGAGKHVVVEKPIDVNLAAARGLIEGASSAGVGLHVISQQRYNPGARRAKELLQDGALGDVLFAYASVPWYRSDDYYASGEWRATWALDGGGAFMNQGVHYADLVCWLLGPPRVEAARCATLGHTLDVEDLALALLSFDSGAAGMLEASTLAYPGSVAQLRVNCRRGTIVLEDGALVAVSTGERGTGSTGAGGPGTGERPSPLSGEVGALGFPGGHRAQLADIASSIIEGRPPPVDGEDGYRALQFVLDVYRAAGWGPS